MSQRNLDEAYRANALFDAHRDDPEFGYRLLADEARDEGQAMSDRTAWRITSANGWWSVFGKKRGKNGKKPGPAVHDDLCVIIDEHGRERHQFTASGPNQLWLTDITEHKTAWIPAVVATPAARSGDACEEVHRAAEVGVSGVDRSGRIGAGSCAVKDAFSGRIVGYSIDSRMKASLAVRAVRNAARMRGNVNGCIVHSDRGSQFRSRKLRRELTAHNLVGSMGRVASCGDNAAMESFFSLLQKNVLNRRSWATREELRIAIVTWIERTYHRRRRQVRLGRLTPVEFETIMNEELALAA